ncbi:7918_t:CDS:1, partial [Funneliformis caledonium]
VKLHRSANFITGYGILKKIGADYATRVYGIGMILIINTCEN